MKAFRMGDAIIAAWLEQDAVKFFCEETGEAPGPVEEIDTAENLPQGVRIKDIINKVLEDRSAWLRLGVPCELDWPFFVRRNQ
jgi:hypothetical protein